MTSKTITNEYGEKTTVELRGDEIWVSHENVDRRKPFLFKPAIQIDARRMAKAEIADLMQKAKADGSVILDNRIILSSQECIQIGSTALELVGEG